MESIVRNLLLSVLAASLAACAATGVSFHNAVLSSDDKPREIQGLLARPDGIGPFPGVVILHTCGGVQPHVSEDWPRFFSRLGYVALTVDTFGSRGLGPCGNALHPAGPGRKTEAYREMTRDAYGALDYLAAQPFIKRDRIAVIGFSLGANTINSYLVYEVKRPAASNFKAAIGVYGRCHDLWRYSPHPDSIPLMQIAGERDEKHVDSCRRLHSSIEVHIIPGAYHSWDDFRASGKVNTYGDYAVYDRAATAKSRELVRDFLARHLGK
jgi:dienelactone hydrolase